MKWLRAFSLLPAFCLAGCMAGPSYHPLKIETPDNWSSPLAGGETNTAPADAAWWKNFGDGELDSLIGRAVSSNLDLRVAEARVREARASLAEARGGLSPTLDPKGSYARTRYSGHGFPPFPPGVPLEENVYQAGFDAAWELDVFGGVRREVEAAGAQEEAAEFGRRDFLVSLEAEAARNYIDARSFQRRLEIARQSIQAQRETLDLTRRLTASGLATDLDVQQAAALLAATEAEPPALETGFMTAAHHLATLIGRTPDAVVDELTNAPGPSVTPPVAPAGLPSGLLLRRPDIRAAERRLAGATAQIGVATADLFPKFSLTGDIALQSISLGDWFTPGSRFWTAGPAVQWRIFDAGRIRANIRVQDARTDAALAQYEQTALTAFEEVENALTGYAREQMRRQSLLAAVDANQKALDLARQLYTNGLTDFLRVLDSQRSLYQSQDAAVVSDEAVSLDLIALYKALGGGWEAVAPLR